MCQYLSQHFEKPAPFPARCTCRDFHDSFALSPDRLLIESTEIETASVNTILCCFQFCFFAYRCFEPKNWTYVRFLAFFCRLSGTFSTIYFMKKEMICIIIQSTLNIFRRLCFYTYHSWPVRRISKFCPENKAK